MPTSEKRIAANKANAKRSTGPTSEIGRRNSSRNSSRHKFLSSAILIEHESPDRFADLLNSLYADFQPSDNTERVLVEKMAVSHWRLMRLWAVEAARITHETRSQSKSTADEAPATRTMLALRSLDQKDRFPDSLGRQERRYDREYYSAMEALNRHRERKSTNEPIQLEQTKGPAPKNEPMTDPNEPISSANEPTPQANEPTI